MLKLWTYHLLWPNLSLTRYCPFCALIKSAWFCFWDAHTPKKCVLPIKIWITLYKPNISPILYWCRIHLGCYIHPLRDSASLLRFATPSLKRTRRAALIPSVITQPKPGKIVSALDLNKVYTILFLRCTYTPKYALPIKVWITPYKPSISSILCQCEICLGCYIHPP